MEQGNLHSASEEKVFYVYGVPEDQKGSAVVKNFFRQNGIRDVSVVGNKVRVVVSGKESIKTMREKFSNVEGHELFIMPEFYKEVRLLIDEEWIEVKDQYCPKFKKMLQGMGIQVSKTPEGVYLVGSLEGINLAVQKITEKVDAEIKKNKVNMTARKVNGYGFHNSESGIHSGSELATESSVNDSELATESLENCQPNGATVEKLLKGAAGSNGVEKLSKSAAGSNVENESDKSDSNDFADAAASTEANVRQSDLFKGPQVESNTRDLRSRNLASSTNTNGMDEMRTADKKVAKKDPGMSSGHINENVADAGTISLQDHQLQFVKRFYLDLYEPLVNYPTLDMSLRSKSYGYFSGKIKENNIDRLIKVTENPKSGRSEFLRMTNVLKRLTTKCGDKSKLLVSDLPQGNTVEIIGLQEDIKMLQKEIDKWREVLVRKTQRECLSLNEQQIKFMTNFYSKACESMDENFVLVKEPDGVTWILGTPDDVDELRKFIKMHQIDHLQMAELRRSTGVDETTCKDILSSFPSEVKVHFEFRSDGKIMIVGLTDDIERYYRMLQIRIDETTNAATKNLEQTSSSNGAVSPVGRTGMTAANHKSNDSSESISSGTDGRRMPAFEIFHLNDFQWQFTQRFHSDLYEQLTDYVEQSHEMKKKHYTQLLDMIKSKNIDRVVKVTENANNVETSVLQRLAARLPRNLKVLFNFPSHGTEVEIIGLLEDAERWWILLRKEIDAYKSDLSKKMPQASHAIQTHELKFIQTFYSEVYDYIKSLHVQKKAEKEIVYAGTFDEVDKLKRWLRKHDVDLLENKTETVPTFVDKEVCKEVLDSMKGKIKLYLAFPLPRMYEVIGFKGDIISFQDKLKQREEVNRKKYLAKSAQTAISSRTESDSSHLYGASSSSDREFAFQTPLSSIQVKIEQGDLTKQKTDAIVNPCNGYLMHMGGAAKAIADAAGRDLLDDCNKYIRKNSVLRTSQVMHSRSGRLDPPIKHVIHACGPNAKEYLDKKKCQDALENTFFNCFEYANNELHVDSLSVPAISSGTFGVPKDIVALSTWKALMRFDDQMSKTSKTKWLKFICFINIDQESTNSLIQTFKKHWNAYLFEQKSKLDAVNSEDSRKSPSTLRRSGSFSGPRRSSVKDQDSASGDIEKVRTSMVKIKQNNDSEESKSVSGTISQGVRPQIKSAGSVVPNSSTESKCCVCLKSRKILSLFARSNCPHKCCALCRSGQCQQCTRSTNIKSGPPSTRALVQSPTGGKKESDVERRPESPESVLSGITKTPRSRRLRRSASVGGRAVDIGDVDLREERSETRAKSAAASSMTDKQQLQQDDNCCICMDKIDNPKKLDCGHIFCKDCIDEAFTHQTKCPSCGRIFGVLKGNQPDGKMTVRRERSLDLEGYRGRGSIIIIYNIPDGIQTADHPNPGQRFHGTSRTAYLPGNAEGEEVCRLLEKAFDAKLVFTIGKSNTTGRDNVVIWNDIHHKTSTVGHHDCSFELLCPVHGLRTCICRYGYPDPTYLQRVKDELAAKGITSDTARASSSVDINSTDKPGSATGGYGLSPYSSWDDNNKGFASLPITGAYASPSVHFRDFRAPSSLLTNIGVGSSSSYSVSDVARVHTASSRSSRAVSPVNSSSSGSHLPSNSLGEWSTTRYNEPLRTSLPQHTSTTSSTYASSSADGTDRYNLRSSSNNSSSVTTHQPSSYFRKYTH